MSSDGSCVKSLVPNVFLLGRDGAGIEVVVWKGVEPIRDWTLNEVFMSCRFCF